MVITGFGVEIGGGAVFIRGARTAGKRCVLVITGRGRAGGGVLKTAVPRWLDEPEFRAQLLAIAPAFSSRGGRFSASSLGLLLLGVLLSGLLSSAVAMRAVTRAPLLSALRAE